MFMLVSVVSSAVYFFFSRSLALFLSLAFSWHIFIVDVWISSSEIPIKMASCQFIHEMLIMLNDASVCMCVWHVELMLWTCAYKYILMLASPLLFFLSLHCCCCIYFFIAFFFIVFCLCVLVALVVVAVKEFFLRILGILLLHTVGSSVRE